MLINVNKPKGITSHDVVDEIRKITGEKRVGHAGTLDPFATGVLVIGVGRESTKKLGDISKNAEKEYIATLELGKVSSTGDPEGVIDDIGRRLDIKHPKIDELNPSQIEVVLKKFQGKILQRPHKYSAVKIKGEPAYKKARRGEDFEIPGKEVEIKEIEIYDADKYGLERIGADIKPGWDPPFLTIRVICSSGTYIRSLAEDIGKKLGTGAYLTQLTRTRVGSFKIEDSKNLKDLKEEFNKMS